MKNIWLCHRNQHDNAFLLVKTNPDQCHSQATGLISEYIERPSLQSFRTGFGISPTARKNMFFCTVSKKYIRQKCFSIIDLHAKKSITTTMRSDAK